MKKTLLAAMFVLCSIAGSANAEGPIRIAFVDTGNTGRSVTAEALANAMIAEKKLDAVVISRAVEVNPYNVAPEPNAATLLLKRGLDVSAHRAAVLVASDVKFSDLILTMTDKHRDTILAQFPAAQGNIYTISAYVTGTSKDVVDAYRQPMAVYAEVFRQIDGYMPGVLEKAVAK